MSKYAIEAESLVKRFGDLTAVNDVSFAVEPGTVLGVLGPNGAGKTTVVRMMTTLSKPTSGSAKVAGFDVVTQAHQVRRNMGLTAQGATVDEILTGTENLRMIGELYGLSPRAAKTRSAELLERFSLSDAGNKVAKQYSGGMRRRLDLAASLVAAPPVLFLDEPTTGLDPRSRGELWDVLRDLVAQGTTLFLTTQYLEEADQLADEIIVINHGSIIAQGSPLQLKDSMGQASLVITVSDAAELGHVEKIAADAAGKVYVARGQRQITAPDGGLDAMVAVVEEVTAAGIELDDIGLQRPTLDDVFLQLTGERTSDPAQPPEEKAE